MALNSAPSEGVTMLPFSQLKAAFPVLRNPANRHKAVGCTYDQWRYAFTNTFPEDQARALYERYRVPPPATSSGTAPSPTSTPATATPT
ncbi:hypothetical protein [Streptomyces sp. NPDC016675]|uniref:hypothetical protein n=1 Tax=Streptomyces sp. NPDC016675 TaxID=3364970 RepID=UPI0036FD2007